MQHCDFCGFEFDPACETEGGCNGCPLSGSCSRIVCPRCGYEMLPEAKLIGWLRKLRQSTAKRVTTSNTEEGNAA